MADHVASASRPRTRPYARPGPVRALASGVLLCGLLFAVVGVSSLINDATKVGFHVVVPVAAEPPDSQLEVTADATQLALPDGNVLRAEGQRWELRSWDSTLTEQVLTGMDDALVGLAALAGALLLSRLLHAVAEGRPFAPGNARRIATLAGLVAVVGTIAPLFPRLASARVLDRIGMVGPDALVYVTEPSLSLDPLLVAALLLVTAECFRRGAELADDVAGLV